MDNYTGYGMGAGTAWWGFVLMFIVMLLVIAGSIIAIRFLWTPTGKQDKKEAIILLEKRFAAGEIDTKEFEEKRKVLSE